MAVAVVEKGIVVYASGFGVSNLDSREPVTADTAFQIGSMTKSFTAATLGILEDQGKLKLSGRPSEYLPGFAFSSERLDNTVTISDLLSHRSGLGSQDGSLVFFPAKGCQDILPRLRYLAPQGEPKDSWIYSNMGYVIAGAIAEKASGKSWDELVQTDLLNPLKMDRSVTNYDAMLRLRNCSQGYGKSGETMVPVLPSAFGETRPSASIVSSANDMSHWLIAWTQGGLYEGRQVIPPAFLTEAISMKAIDNGAPPDRSDPGAYLFGYGYGWKIASNKGHFKVHHGGNISGFSSQMVIYPSDDLGVVVMTNQDRSLLPYMVADVLTNRMLMLPTKPVSDYPVSVQEARVSIARPSSTLNAKLPSHPVPDYAGEYFHPGYGTIKVDNRNGILYATMPGGEFWLEHQQYDTFRLVPVAPMPQLILSDFFLNFRSDFEGSISGVSADFTAADVEFRRANPPRSSSLR
jgi:CubicO group peptidase (beta-lactamase class C family)